MSDIANSQYDPLVGLAPIPSKPSRRPDTAPTPPKTRPKTNDATYLSYLRTLYTAARKERQARIDSWNRNYKIVNNRYQSAQFASWAPQPRDSEVYPICSSLVAWLTDQEPDVGFTPAVDPTSPYFQQVTKVAGDLNNVFETSWQNEEYDREYKVMIWDGLICGTGIVKSIWDNAAADGAGNAIVKRIDPYNFFPDPKASSLDSCQYMVETSEMTFDEIQRMYPDTAFLLYTGASESTDNRPKLYGSSILPRSNLGFLPSGNGLWSGRGRNGGPPQATTSYTVYEYWLRENTYTDLDIDDNSPGENAYAIPKWKCVVVCAGNILFEEWAEDLWSHKSHPYDDWRFDDIGEFWGISLVDHLSLPQLYINRLLTALQQNSELCGNPIFVEPANSGTQRTAITNRPGERLSVQANNASSNLPRWLQPPSMPTTVMDLVNFWISRIENTAGINGMQKGQDPSQRVSNNTVNSVQEAAFVRIRSSLTNLGWTYRRSATKLASLISQNYTESRIMAILGPDGESTSIFLRPFHFYDPATDSSEPLRFIIRADAGANQATSRQARVAQANTLFAMGVVDDQYVLGVNGIRDSIPLLQRLYAKRQAGLMPGNQGGQRQKAGRTS
jgi:hypothetical protein